MTDTPESADRHRALPPVICYPPETLPAPDLRLYGTARKSAGKCHEILVPPREARTFDVPAGHFFRITSVDGPQGYVDAMRDAVKELGVPDERIHTEEGW